MDARDPGGEGGGGEVPNLPVEGKFLVFSCNRAVAKHVLKHLRLFR